MKSARRRYHPDGKPLLLALALCLTPSVFAGDWPRFLGPNGNSITAEAVPANPWKDGEPKIPWKANVGLGHSSVVVAAGRLFTAGHTDGQDTVFAFDARSGQPLWKHSYVAELGDNSYEGGTTGTPTVDQDRVYWLGKWGDLFCFNAADGQIIWFKQIATDIKANVPDWGFAGAPLVHEKLLVLNVGEAGLALDKSNGEIVWKSENKDAGYSSPILVQHQGEWLAFFSNAEHYLAVNILTGREIWRYKWLTQYGLNAANPVVSGDRVFISTGYGKGGVLLNLSSGQPVEVWKTKLLRTQLSTAVLFNGYLYGPDGDTTPRASLKCLEFATGVEKWSYPDFGSAGVIIANGKLIAIASIGELMIAPASPAGFKPSARAQVLGGTTWTAPVLANGLVYCRNGRGDLVAVSVAD